MATADPNSGTWGLVCRRCQRVVREGPGALPEPTDPRVTEAQTSHQVVCASQDFVLVRRGRITED